MYRSIILSAAKNDIKEAAHWYEQQQTGLGKKLTREVRKKFRQLSKTLLRIQLDTQLSVP